MNVGLVFFFHFRTRTLPKVSTSIGKAPAPRSAEMGRALVKTRCLAVAYIDKDEDAIGRWALPKGLLR